MFLEELNTKERKNFLELAYFTMLSDGVIAEEEQVMFNRFRVELQLSEKDYAIQEKSISTILNEFNASKKRIKKIVMFELWGIMLANHKLDEKQQELVEKIKNEWNLRDFEVNRMKRWVEDFNELIIEAYGFMEN